MNRSQAFLELEERAKHGDEEGTLINTKMVAVREDTSDIIIGETLVTVKTDSLCASYIEADKFLIDNIDGG